MIIELLIFIVYVHPLLFSSRRFESNRLQPNLIFTDLAIKQTPSTRFKKMQHRFTKHRLPINASLIIQQAVIPFKSRYDYFYCYLTNQFQFEIQSTILVFSVREKLQDIMRDKKNRRWTILEALKDVMHSITTRFRGGSKPGVSLDKVVDLLEDHEVRKYLS